MGKSERIRHEFCLRLTTPNVWLISVKKLVFPFTDLLSGRSALGVALSPYSRNGSGQEVEGGVRRLCDA